MDTAMLQAAAPLLGLYCNNAHDWQLYFDTNHAIRDAFGEAGFPAAEQPIVIRTDGARPVGATR